MERGPEPFGVRASWSLGSRGATVYDDPWEPSPGQCWSAVRVSGSMLTNERITLQLRASMGVKRQFMSDLLFSK